MLKLLTLVLSFLLILINGIEPPKECVSTKPFKLNDETCGSFEEICIKKDDPQCEQLLNSCQQCPPNNITIITLRDILKYSKSLSDFGKQLMENKIPNIIVQLNTTHQFMENKMNGPLSYYGLGVIMIFLTIIIVLLIILLLLENRFKLITKLAQYTVKKNPSNYRLLNSRKRTQMENDSEQIRNLIVQEIVNQLKGRFIQINERLEKLETGDNKKFEYVTITFIVDDKKHGKLNVLKNDKVHQIKLRLCYEISEFKAGDYKRMELKYEGRTLNDEDCLFEFINSSNLNVYCSIDLSKNPKDIRVVKLVGKSTLPCQLSINVKDNVIQVKDKIVEISKIKNISIFKYFENKLIEIKENDEFDDGECLTVVEWKDVELSFSSEFFENRIEKLKFRNTNTISELVNKIGDHNAILFYKNVKLDKNKFLFEYEIYEDCTLDYLKFKSLENSNMKLDEPLVKNEIFKLRNATFGESTEKFLLKIYPINILNYNNCEIADFLKNELIAFKITKSQPRFVQLVNVFADDRNLCFQMEFLSHGTLESYLKKQKLITELSTLCKWSFHILLALEFLHKNRIIFRDLNPLNILLDENINLKLISFNLSKYDNWYSPSSVMNKEKSFGPLKVRYMAPEILDSKSYGEQCDIWSFAAVLIRIITGKKPYPNSSPKEAEKRIINLGKIEYNLANSFTYFKPIIDSCLKPEPKERETITYLKSEIGTIQYA